MFDSRFPNLLRVSDAPTAHAAVIRRVADDVVSRAHCHVCLRRTNDGELHLFFYLNNPGFGIPIPHTVSLAVRADGTVRSGLASDADEMVRHVQRSRWSPEQKLVAERRARADAEHKQDQAFAAAVEDRTHEIESQYDYWKRVATMGRHSRRMAVVDGLKGGV